jgi:hypothetical protein
MVMPTTTVTTMSDTAERTARAADPVLVALAHKHPELDSIRWKVRLRNNRAEFISGDKADPTSSGSLRFLLDDGTEREFARGEWLSAVAMPGTVEPNLDQIIRRLHLFGLASHLDIINQGAWLQAQPEWIAHERGVASPSELDQSERAHALRRIGL